MNRRQPAVINGIECWLCPTCAAWKSRDEYYRRARSWNGIGTQCRQCHIAGSIATADAENKRRICRESMARRRKAEPEKARAYDRKASATRIRDIRSHARAELNSAVRGGIVSRPSCCAGCGREGRVHGHHADYSKPLAVEWLCSLCHGLRHRKQPAQIGGAR